jgi:exodeoxyribonuclease-3
MLNVKIASFNVNSIKARLPRVLEWLKKSNPDIVLLQELKCVESDFPFEALFDAGYNAAVFGQKTYNGVAILSKFKIEDVVKGLPNFEDEQARYIEAVINLKNSAIRVSSIYVPNGGSELAENETLENSKKFLYKLEFYDRLKSRLSKVLSYDEIQIFGGDFNVAAEEIDCFDPKHSDGKILFHPQERQKFRSLLNLGLIDSFRSKHKQTQQFSWWDYRGGAWDHNKGFRIDYILTSPQAADKTLAASVEDKGVRDQEKASDHCPVCLTLSLG